MQASELRKAFRDFFIRYEHQAVPSASLIPHDPTVMFTVAGMVPFKPYFVGEETPPYKRAVTVQKCARAGGKHNDLDEIGRTKRHLTFFEMLGNFSFGDYFKEKAIPIAWEFTTEVLGFDPEQLWVTVHLSDDESEEIWRDSVGVPANRIQRLDEDNYWKMADTGPNGPCSEIFIDKGAAFGEPGGPAHGGEERYLEFWNLVFMQYETLESGEKVALPAPSIDTGAGLERILTLVQGVDSVFDIDEMKRLVNRASDVSKTAYGQNESADISMRIMADHARASTFLISDGVFPSNEERGYVLRRIMRRAIRHAYLLGCKKPVFGEMVDEVVATMGADYPEIKENHDFVRGVVEREEESFRRTLQAGSTMLSNSLDELKADEPLSGETVFTLHDTYGFPLEVTSEIAAERGIEIDTEGFEAQMAQQRERGRADHKAKAGGADDLSSYSAIVETHGQTEFVGRELDECQATVLGISDIGIVLDKTPFYAESGGQIGDTGELITSDGNKIAVTDTTYAVAGVNLHHTKDAASLSVGDVVTAKIDSARRAEIKRHHTAAHLLHYALRAVLGDHVRQQGSWVGPDRVRFDFSHYEALSDEQITEIEDLVAKDVLANPTTSHIEMTMEEATAKGAIAFFGDKYGDRVRVLTAGDNSVELCGGTHVSALGDIGVVKIIHESSIGSNIRRIEAVCGTGPLALLREQQQSLNAASKALNVPVVELVEGAKKRVQEIKTLRDEISNLRREVAVAQAPSLAATQKDGVVIAEVKDIDRDGLKDLALAVKNDPNVNAVVLAAAPPAGGVALVAVADTEAGFHAGDLIAPASRHIKGGGGKGPQLAIAGGKNPDGIEAALEAASQAAEQQLASLEA